MVNGKMRACRDAGLQFRVSIGLGFQVRERLGSVLGIGLVLGLAMA